MQTVRYVHEKRAQLFQLRLFRPQIGAVLLRARQVRIDLDLQTVRASPLGVGERGQSRAPPPLCDRLGVQTPQHVKNTRRRRWRCQRHR